MVKLRKTYDVRPLSSEVNELPSETVTTGYIPIDEQVKMIMRGEITIGNLDVGFEDATEDIDQEAPEEVFEDSTDLFTEYSDEFSSLVKSGELNKANDSAETQQKQASDVSDEQALASEEQTEESAV